MARRGRQLQPGGNAVTTGVGVARVVPDPRAATARLLLIDGDVHGHVDLAEPARLHLDYQARLAALARALLPEAGGRVVHLGGGAFAIPRALRAADPTLHQVVVERSAAVIRLAQRELGLRADDRLVVRKGDARAQLARLPGAAADVVVGDAFVGARTPDHLATAEFLAEVARVLAPGGAYVVNLVDEQPWSVLGAHAATAATAFADLVAAGSRGVARLRDPGNVLLVAGSSVPRHRLAAALAVGSHPGALVADGRLGQLVRLHRPRSDADLPG